MATRPDFVTTFTANVGAHLEFGDGQCFRGPIVEVIEQGNETIEVVLGWVARRIAAHEYGVWSFEERLLLSGRSYQIKIDKKEAITVFGRSDRAAADTWEPKELPRPSHIILPCDARNTGPKLEPHQVKGMPFSLTHSSTWDFPRVELGNDEWATLEAMPAHFGHDTALLGAFAAVRSQDGYVWPGELHALADARYTNALTENVAPERQAAAAIFDKVIKQIMKQTRLPEYER